MSNRITIKQLETQCEALNEITDSPMEYAGGIGHFHISQAYGGVMLARLCNDSGAIDCPLGNYHRPKRELFEQLYYYIRGIEMGQDITATHDTCTECGCTEFLCGHNKRVY